MIALAINYFHMQSSAMLSRTYVIKDKAKAKAKANALLLEVQWGQGQVLEKWNQWLPLA